MKALRLGMICALAGGVLAVWMHQQKSNARLAADVEMLRRQNSEIPVLQADNRRLAATVSARAEAVRSKQEERERLQAQITALRKQVEAMEQRRAAAQAQARARSEPKPSPVLAPGTMLVESMQNVGRTTPTLALQTGFWAQSRGDVQTILDGLVLEPAGKAKLDALFGELSATEQAHFGSPERLAAILVAGPMLNRGGGPGTPVQIVEIMQSAETAELGLRVPLPSGEFKDIKTVQFRRYADGWKAVLPAGETEMLRNLLHGLPPSQRMRLGGK